MSKLLGNQTILLSFAIWILLNALSLFSPIRKKLISTLPPLSFGITICVIIIESISIVVVLLNPGEVHKYSIFFGLLILLIGWVISNNRILSPRVDHKYRLIIRNYIFYLIGIDRDYYYLTLAGDWLQLIGFSIILNSVFGLLFSLLIIPLVIHLLTITLMPPKSATTGTHIIQPTNSFIWLGWISIIRILFIASLPIILLALINQDISIYKNTVSAASSLLEALVQTEATVFTLVMTSLFVVIEFTNITYTPRLLKLILSQSAFKLMLLLTALSIFIKVLVISNINNIKATGFVVDMCLLLSIEAVLGFTYFIQSTYSFMTPEILTRKILSDFNKGWIDNINDEWKGSKWNSRTIYIELDPMIHIERILSAALVRGDTNSFLACLIQMRDKLDMEVAHLDPVALDAYLAERLTPTISTGAKLGQELSLTHLCDFLQNATNPSAKVINDQNDRYIEEFPGCKLFKTVLDKSIHSSLVDSSRTAMYHLNQRALQMIKSLPPFDELGGSISKETNGIKSTTALRELYRKNERKVENYKEILRYFGDAGVTAIKKNMTEISCAATSYITDQIGQIIENIKDESHQNLLIRYAWFEFEKVIESACVNNKSKTICMTTFGFYNKVKNEQLAFMISEELSTYMRKLERAGILDWIFVHDAVSIISDFTLDYPESTIPMIDAIGDVGMAIQEKIDKLQYGKGEQLLNELDKAINEFESYYSEGETKMKVSNALIQSKNKMRRHYL